MFGGRNRLRPVPNSHWMRKVTRLTASLAATAVAALASASVGSAAQPTPSPALSSVLIAPTGTYAESQNPQDDGPVTADDYANSDSLILDELKKDHWVQGYARTWVAQDQKHLVVEEVVAFGGHRDAVNWMTTFKSMSASQYLVRPITADGVDTFFGNHYAEPSRPLYLDQGAFLKGNDFFTVSALSQADDLGDVATKQAKRQFDAAPAYSIAPNQWPENAKSNSFNFSAAVMPVAIGGGVVLVVLILAALVVVVVVTRRRPLQPALATAGGAPAAAEGPLMSEDGRYWWDGQAWRDATKEVPPDALRSGDGYYWWDSRTWRPMPPAN